MKEETVEERKRAHELCQLPTSLAAFTDQFKEGKAYLHLKLNLAKSYKQKASPNYTTQRYGNLEDLPSCTIDRATRARCCSDSRNRWQKMEKCNTNIN